MSESIAARVARGAAFLDRKIPGWTDRIHPSDLDLYCCARCIVGQLLGGFSLDSLTRLWPALHGDEDALYTAAFNHGFTLAADPPEAWRHLTSAWIAEIRRRTITSGFAFPAPAPARGLVNV